MELIECVKRGETLAMPVSHSNLMNKSKEELCNLYSRLYHDYWKLESGFQYLLKCYNEDSSTEKREECVKNGETLAVDEIKDSRSIGYSQNKV